MLELMFKGARSRELRILLDVVQGIVSGPRKWNFYKDKLVVAGMDGASSVFVMFEIEKSFFDSYKVDESVLGLSIDDLKKIFSRSIKDSSTVTMKYNNTENKFIISFDEGGPKVEYKISVHVPEEKDSAFLSKVKSIPLGCSIKFEGGGNLKNLLSDISIVAQKESKHLVIRTTGDGELTFELKGDATGISA
ncbi:MAG TPA: hypothetical protein VJ044_02645, partial [Candidatus Hodarchaeales archaeon]|nr:hypothetical protein [Candidatus Hodarchaeales archaeon]